MAVPLPSKTLSGDLVCVEDLETPTDEHDSAYTSRRRIYSREGFPKERFLLACDFVKGCGYPASSTSKFIGEWFKNSATKAFANGLPMPRQPAKALCKGVNIKASQLSYVLTAEDVLVVAWVLPKQYRRRLQLFVKGVWEQYPNPITQMDPLFALAVACIEALQAQPLQDAMQQHQWGVTAVPSSAPSPTTAVTANSPAPAANLQPPSSQAQNQNSMPPEMPPLATTADDNVNETNRMLQAYQHSSTSKPGLLPSSGRSQTYEAMLDQAQKLASTRFRLHPPELVQQAPQTLHQTQQTVAQSQQAMGHTSRAQHAVSHAQRQNHHTTSHAQHQSHAQSHAQQAMSQPQFASSNLQLLGNNPQLAMNQAQPQQAFYGFGPGPPEMGPSPIDPVVKGLHQAVQQPSQHVSQPGLLKELMNATMQHSTSLLSSQGLISELRESQARLSHGHAGPLGKGGTPQATPPPAIDTSGNLISFSLPQGFELNSNSNSDSLPRGLGSNSNLLPQGPDLKLNLNFQLPPSLQAASHRAVQDHAYKSQRTASPATHDRHNALYPYPQNRHHNNSRPPAKSIRPNPQPKQSQGNTGPLWQGLSRLDKLSNLASLVQQAKVEQQALNCHLR